MERETYDKDLERYENLLWSVPSIDHSLLLDPRSYPLELEDSDFIDLLDDLGEEPLKVINNEEYTEMRVIFRGGEVQYTTANSSRGFIPKEMILYGVTASPGERALNTKHLDIHIPFNIEDVGFDFEDCDTDEDYQKKIAKEIENRPQMLLLSSENLWFGYNVVVPEFTDISDYFPKKEHKSEEQVKKDFLDVYEKILWEKLPRGNDILLDPRKIVPIEFDSIGHYIKQLGREFIDVKIEQGKFKMIFEGGHVVYYEHIRSNRISYIPTQVVLYGATVAPGKRSPNTEALDTHIDFSTRDLSRAKRLKPSEFKIKELDMIMDIAVYKPDEKEIKKFLDKRAKTC